MYLHNKHFVDENKCNKTKGNKGKEGCGVMDSCSKGVEPGMEDWSDGQLLQSSGAWDGKLWSDGQLLQRGGARDGVEKTLFH